MPSSDFWASPFLSTIPQQEWRALASVSRLSSTRLRIGLKGLPVRSQVWIMGWGERSQ